MSTSRLLAPLGLTLLTACAQHGPEPVTLDADSECPIYLEKGQVLNLTLPSNPSTGYRWRVEAAATPVLLSLGPEVYSAPDQEDVVGSEGLSTWRYQADQSGKAALKLVYQQPWARQVTPVQTFDCNVVVR
ncbi:UNVERIFIED_ORG: inhibitor of cysteine peptidase [Pseudomonas parafulva]|uniref:protease inhibitor I42 family protein n=1 Tax=Pseudomonas TaxID=286 RepID=UPI0004866AE8|nr:MULTISPECIES: protease inhibitor I42 family protein [Pseudomonas]MDP9557957.1 inhibitor of cysteine peptidase [Pseudomonas parafulva]MCP3789142.1 protease inhibitor I42 family protein [Pseudomonas sp. N2-11]QDC05679.1 peptidase inhibitor I42 [Pseudomonas sp. SWI7]RDL17244.1 inhibitor of cysteine peptidase [Pseudomonas sp. LAMO17WK12:I3]RED02284.1 inhibitor of cysteine peptidase [Pseudomonas sp. URMO17WK12:I10]